MTLRKRRLLLSTLRVGLGEAGQVGPYAHTTVTEQRGILTLSSDHWEQIDAKISLTLP